MAMIPPDIIYLGWRGEAREFARRVVPAAVVAHSLLPPRTTVQSLAAVEHAAVPAGVAGVLSRSLAPVNVQISSYN